MKRLLISLGLMLIVCYTHGQSRKQIASFSQFKHYYNPSLTGFEGAVVRTVYRNQWTGFADAPKTLLASAELDLSIFGHKQNNYRFRGYDSKQVTIGHGLSHAIALIVMNDHFGPSNESQAAINYGGAIRVSREASVRWGAMLNYRLWSFDGNSLTLEQENDPTYAGMLGRNNRRGTLDIGLGVSLVSSNYYVGYAMQDITAGEVVSSGDDFLNSLYNRKHIAQIGYKAELNDKWKGIVNGIYQYDKEAKSSTEGQLKALYQNTVWGGFGYRYKQAYNVTAGLNFNQFTVGYTYENPLREAHGLNKSTNEVMLNFRLVEKENLKQNKEVHIW